MAGDFNGDGLDDLFDPSPAALNGDWFVLYARSSQPWAAWEKVCASRCLGQTKGHLFLGDFDGTNDIDIFSDDYKPGHWGYYTFIAGAPESAKWVELGEFADKRPDIVAGEFVDGAGGSATDILRVGPGGWEVSRNSSDPFMPFPGGGGRPPPGHLGNEVVAVDLDQDGFDEVLHGAHRW